MTPRDEGPRWIAEAVRQAAHELRSFVTTGVAFTRAPGRFTEEWYGGTRKAMNPLACLATAAAVVSFPMEQVLARYAPETTSSSVLIQGLSAIGPYLHYGALGALAHLFLRLTGSPSRLWSSVGVALFAGALPGSASSLLALPVGVHMATHPGSCAFGLALDFLLLAVFGVFLWTLGVALGRLHGVSRARAFAALGAALFVTAIVLGFLGPLHIRFGLHPTIHLRGPEFGLVIP
jgi:hypothetical protein